MKCWYCGKHKKKLDYKDTCVECWKKLNNKEK